MLFEMDLEENFPFDLQLDYFNYIQTIRKIYCFTTFYVNSAGME